MPAFTLRLETEALRVVRVSDQRHRRRGSILVRRRTTPRSPGDRRGWKRIGAATWHGTRGRGPRRPHGRAVVQAGFPARRLPRRPRPHHAGPGPREALSRAEATGSAHSSSAREPSRPCNAMGLDAFRRRVASPRPTRHRPRDRELGRCEAPHGKGGSVGDTGPRPASSSSATRRTRCRRSEASASTSRSRTPSRPRICWRVRCDRVRPRSPSSAACNGAAGSPPGQRNHCSSSFRIGRSIPCWRAGPHRPFPGSWPSCSAFPFFSESRRA